MLPDPLALLLSFVYIAAAIGVGELLRRMLGLSSEFTRKFIHIAVGMYIILTVIWFGHLAWAIIPPLAFVAINYLDYRFGLIQAMMSSNRSNLGTVYFPLAFAIVLAIFWGDPSRPASHPHIIVASIMPLTWGDALAAVVGKQFGRRAYTLLGSTRTLEGSAAMFFASALAVFAALWALPLPSRLAVALLAAAGATVAEAVSPWGIDNLTVPAVSALIIGLMAR